MGGNQNKVPLARRGVAALANQALSVDPEPFLTLRLGHRVGDLPSPGPNDNLAYHARLAYSRLYGLWACTAQEYQDTLRLWAPLQPTDQLTGAKLAPLITAIRKALVPTLAAEVAQQWLPVQLAPGGTVGLNGTDEAGLDQVRRALGALRDHQKITVRRTAALFRGVTKEQVDAKDRWATISAIRELKRGIASGTLGWAAIRADEDASGVDRFCGRTFFPFSFPGRYKEISAFVPEGARPGACSVHLFFSPGAVCDSSPGYADKESGYNAILMHGIRAAFAKSKWVVIGVPGYDGEYNGTNIKKEDLELENKKFSNYISTDQIIDILNHVWGRNDCTIESLSLSAHSRGVNALIYTLGGSPVPGEAGTKSPKIEVSKVVKVTVFDDRSPELGVTMKRVGLDSKAQVLLATEEVNTSGLTAVDLRSPKLVAKDPLLAKECWRAIGYVRFIDDAIRMGLFVPPPPQQKMDLVNLIVGGSPAWKERLRYSVSELQALSAAHAENGDMAKILHPNDGLREYVYITLLLRLLEDKAFSEGIDRHHFHVAEVAHLAVP